MEQTGDLDSDRGGGEFVDSTLGFWRAFAVSVSVILFSELGDRTFLITAIMSMRHSRMTVFAGALSSSFVMVLISAFLGWTTQVIPRIFTHYVSAGLFAVFGLKMLKEGWKMAPDAGEEEYEEALEDTRSESETNNGVSNGGFRRQKSAIEEVRYLSKTFLKTFMLNFMAEWGDRSQLTTILLAAREDFTGVVLGGTFGHAVCVGIAVLGGRMIAQRISVRTVTLLGGAVFILFALSALVLKNDSERQ